jgi:hypothetical protein
MHPVNWQEKYRINLRIIKVLYKLENLYDTNFDALDVHFDFLSFFSDAHAKTVKINGENCQIAEKTKQGAMKMKSNQIRRRM